MKHAAATLALSHCVGAVKLEGPGREIFASLRSRLTPLLHLHQSDGSAALVSSSRAKSSAHFGDTECPCIGFDNIDGETTVVFDDEEGQVASYPADLGARCEKWDDNTHPSCKDGQTPGEGNGWCAQAWCFVDSCNCNIPVLPQPSEYVPDARYRGRPLFYSYATCGGEDMWSQEVPEIGEAGCRCIGFDGVPGTTEVTLKGHEAVKYPAEIGGTCQAWDRHVHPECEKGSDSPSWCKQRWCYVDPCSCDLKPKVTMYLPEATFTGKSLYYSYETCKSKDTFTKKYNTEACVNQKSKEDCTELKTTFGSSKCAWTGSACLGAELVNHPLCKKTVEKHSSTGERVRPVALLLSLLLGLGLCA